MKDSVILRFDEQVRAAVVDLCMKVALHIFMNVDEAFLRVHEGKDKRTTKVRQT